MSTSNLHVLKAQIAKAQAGSEMPLSLFGDLADSTVNQFAVHSQESLHGVSIHKGFAMLCDSTATPQTLYEHCTETPL